MASPDDKRRGRPRDGGRVATRVSDEVREARDEVFRAYVRAREKARELGDDDRSGPGRGDGLGPSADGRRR